MQNHFDARKPLWLLAGLVLMVSDASALSIVRNFTGGSGGGSNTGTGTLQTVFNAAANCWEAAILDSHTVTLNFGWGSLGGGVLGRHSFGSGSGSPYRETSGSIEFSNSFNFFLDSNPLDTSEYNTYTESSANFGGGVLNTGRVYTGATGLAAGQYDLFSVALHEIGHALGLSSGNSAFITENGDLDIDVTGPRPFAGSALPTVSGAHLNISTSLMYPSIGTDTRRFFSAADILANAQISQFSNINLDPHAPVPEPATMSLAGLALAYAAKRRRKSA